MPAQRCARAPKRAIMPELGLAIAEMQPPRGEARCVAEKPSHSVARTVGINDGLAQDHVAAALAMDRARRGKAERGPA